MGTTIAPFNYYRDARQLGVLPDLDNADRTFYDKNPILEISRTRLRNTMEK